MPQLSIDLAMSGKVIPRPHRMGGRSPNGESIGLNSFHFLRNDQPWLPVMGEFQYSRYPRELWEEELRKIKAGGVDIVATYVFWIHHEEEEGVFDWSGRRDVRRFVELCGKHGLWVMMRIGPFCHGEVRNGGLPDWVYGCGFDARKNDPRYLFHVKRLYQQIGRQLKGMMFKEGGAVIGLQCENEFMDSAAPWETTHNTAMAYTPKGADGMKHMMTLKRMAVAADLDVPLHTCTGWGASPVDPGEFLPMFGGYGYYSWLDDPSSQEPTSFFLFRDMPNRKTPKYDPRRVPFACCEIGGGVQVFYKNRPRVPPEGVEAMHVVQLGSGSNLMGYYVYHGGINPVGKHAFLNEHRCPRISYDFQAPLGEFGQRRPHYDLLRRQFLFLKAFGGRLAPMQVAITPSVADGKPTDTDTVRWDVRAKDEGGYVFLNNFQDHVEMPDQTDIVLSVRTRGGETIPLPPSGQGMTLKKGVACILPFNFEMDGLQLKSATVQPLTRLDLGDAIHYFFFAPRGLPAEYAFVRPSFTTMESQGATSRQVGELTLVKARPGTDCLLTFTLSGGKKVLVTTLSDEQSKQFWQAEMAGRDRVFLSQAQLLFDKNEVEMRQVGSETMGFGVYPPFKAKNGPQKDGIFQRYIAHARHKSIKVSVRKISDGKVAVRIPHNALRGACEVYLQIQYLGDTGSAYLGGKLIHDHFGNGSIWEIALRPFAPRITKEELVLVLTPRQEKGGAKVNYSGMAAMKVIGGGDSMEFHSVRATVEYSATVKVR